MRKKALALPKKRSHGGFLHAADGICNDRGFDGLIATGCPSRNKSESLRTIFANHFMP